MARHPALAYTAAREYGSTMTGNGSTGREKPSLALDVAGLRRKLGPVKVALIERWIREVNGPFDAAIAPHVHPGAVVLDLGCSRGDPDLPSPARGRLYVGVDEDLAGLRGNGLADAVVMAPVTALPLASESVDVLVMKWVAEHLAAPGAAFAECARVLKPGGVLCVLTPNAHSVFTGLSRLVPHGLKQRLKGRLFGLHEKDTFRTYYRANTVGRLARLTRAAGLFPERVALLPGMWTFFIFSRRAALTVRFLEHVQGRIPGLRRASTHILGVWRKPPEEEGHA